MPLLLDTTGLVLTAGLFGTMAFFSVVLAPLIFVKLEADTAAGFVRAIFPWYFLVIALLGLGAGSMFLNSRPVEATVMLAIGAGALLSRQVLLPAINRSRDAALAGSGKADRRFTWLHRASVGINLVQLLATLFVLVRFAWVA